MTLALPGSAQHRITGRVVDAVTGSPVAGASIFINNTTYGTSSTGNGDFSIAGVPVGNYEVVVSAMGYHTYAVSIHQDGKQPVHLGIALNVKLAVLEEVEIIAFEKDGWKRWGRLFFETFIGTASNAAQTKLLNHEVIRFRYNKENKLLEIVASEPLRIENRSLGYHLEYILENCQIDLENQIYFLFGYPHFQEMEASNTRKRRFERRRKETYATSMMRFMRTLHQGTLHEEGYQVRRMERKPNTEKQRVLAVWRNLYQTVWDSTRQINVFEFAPTDRYTADSLAYFDKVSKEPDEIVTVFPCLLTADSLLTIAPDGSKRLAFSDFLHIRNIHLLERNAYLEYMNEARKPDIQTSMLSLMDFDYVYLESNGSYFPPQAVFTSGYWAWCDKLADLLPLDYMPPNNH